MSAGGGRGRRTPNPRSCWRRWRLARRCRRWRVLRPQQVCGWLREARKAAEPAPAFVPVVVEPAEPPRTVAAKRRRKPRVGGDIEIEIDGVLVRIGRGAEAKTVATVIQALKADQ